MRSSRIPTVCLSLLVLGCAKPADQATIDSSAALMAHRPGDSVGAATNASGAGTAGANAAGAMSIGSLAGRWTMVSTPTEGKNMSPTTITLSATSDTTGWTMSSQGKPPVPLHVRVAGDSVVTVSDPYPSFRRAGVQVVTTSVMRMHGDTLVGNTVARYRTTGADTVLHLRTRATRQ